MKFWGNSKKSGISLRNSGKFAKLLLGKDLVEKDCYLELTDENGKPHIFGDYYNNHIRHYVQDFERDRIKALHTFRKRSSLGLLAGIFIIIGSIHFFLTYVPSGPENNAYDGVIALNFIAYAIITGWCYMPVKKYKSSVKSVIFPKIFGYFGPSFFYSEQSPINVKTLEKSHLIPSYDNAKAEDYIKGVHNDVSLESSEVRLTETRGSGKRRRTVTVFHGLLITLSMNKKFSGQTVIKHDKGRILNFFSSTIKGMEKIELEDPKFEKMFEVQSTDQVEARYLLTVTFMDRLVQLANLFTGKIECSFYDDQLLMKIDVDHDMFETASIFEPATFEKDIKTILKEMEQIFAIIDILKLNMKIGL